MGVNVWSKPATGGDFEDAKVRVTGAFPKFRARKPSAGCAIGDMDNLLISVSGVGNVNLSEPGRVMGACDFSCGEGEAFGLSTETCNISISGSGNRKRSPRYHHKRNWRCLLHGTPAITSSISGAGNMIDSN